MTTTESARRRTSPERLAGQGLDPNQEESGNRAIVALLTDGSHGETDWVATYRYDTDADGAPAEGAYEVWSLRGMVRFRRFLAYRWLDLPPENSTVLNCSPPAF